MGKEVSRSSDLGGSCGSLSMLMSGKVGDDFCNKYSIRGIRIVIPCVVIGL